MNRHVAIALVWFCAACGQSDPIPEETEPEVEPASCDPASEPQSATVGDYFPDASITDCAGVKQTLQELRCDNEITLISIGAGWCEPCKEETPQLEQAADALAPDGAGIVQVLFQDNSANAATTSFCESWVDQFALTIPVFVDPVGNTLEAFEDTDIATQMPLNVIVDREGKVLFSETGLLADVEGTIRQYLP